MCVVRIFNAKTPRRKDAREEFDEASRIRFMPLEFFASSRLGVEKPGRLFRLQRDPRGLGPETLDGVIIPGLGVE